MATPTSTQIFPSTPQPNDSVVADLRNVYLSGVTRGLHWRQVQLDGIIALLDEQEQRIATALAADLGRNPTEAWLGDIAATRAEAAYARKHLHRWMRKRRTGLPLAQRPGSAWVQYDPLGVVLVIGPWNYPVYLTLGPLIAAVAAGNTAIVKPSEVVPATSALLAELIPRYLDPRAIRVVEGDALTTQGLINDGVDHIVFTGGTEVGRKIMAAAAPTLTPVLLELGGKSPVVVAADADLDVAARRIAWLKLLNSGQTCIAPDYVLVDASVADALVSKITATIAEFQSGGADSALRIVNVRQFDRLATLITSTTGAVVCGGELERTALTITPTVITNPGADDLVMTEEIFGPILPILPYESVDAAVDLINSRPKPLALYVFSASKPWACDVIDRVPSGGAVVNHLAMHCMVPQLPFGGVGASGMGAYHGRWGFEALSHRRAVLVKTTWLDPRLVYPPYTDRALAIMRKLF